MLIKGNLPVMYNRTIILSVLLFVASISIGRDARAQINPRGALEFVSSVGTLDDGSLDLLYDSNLIYVANKYSGLQIIDFSNFESPKVLSRVATIGQNFGIAKKGKHVFVTDLLAGLLIFDVTDPKDPKKIGEIDLSGGEAWDVAIYKDHAFIAAGLNGLVVVDVSNPEFPVEITKIRFDRDWDFARRLFIQGDILYLADRKAGIHIIDISTPTKPRELKRYLTNFANDIYVEDGIAYVADGPSGLVILDVSNPVRVRRLSDLEFPGYANGVIKSGTYVYLAIDNAGIRAVDITNPRRPVFDARYDTPGQAYSMLRKDIYLVVADGGRTITFLHNKPPLMYAVGDKTVAENQMLKFKVNGEDPDGNPTRFSASFVPLGASFSSDDSLFTWTPGFEQAGVYKGIVFTITEKTKTKLFSRDTISITVKNTNRPPSLPGTGTYAVDENKTLGFSINPASDPDREDAGKLKIELTNPPQGGKFNPDSLSFSWIPAYDQSGEYVLKFKVTDSFGATDLKESKVTVNNINRPPVIADIDAKYSVKEDQDLTIQIKVQDPDKEDAGKLTVAAFNLPPGATFDDQANSYSWKPTYDQSGLYRGLYFIVKDMEGLTDTTYTAIEVIHVNRAPFFADVPAQTIDEDKPLSFVIVVDDPDIEDAGKLTVAASDLPAGAAFDAATNTFTWTPTFDQSGDYVINFEVNDQSGAKDLHKANVKINNINRPPTITAIEAVTGDENKEISIIIPEGQDPDKEDVGKLTYQVADLPQGCTFDAAQRKITWTPTYDQSGEYVMTVTVKDVLGLTASTPLKLTVNHVNRAPALEVVSAQVVAEVAALSFTIKGADLDKEDAGKLKLSVTNLPEGATFNASTGVVSWTPTYEQSGTYDVNYTITDPQGLLETKTVQVTVSNVNRKPALAAVANQTVEENKALTFSLAGSDPDKEDVNGLKYSAQGLPTGAVLGADGQFSWTPGFDQSGAYKVTFTVTDVAGLQDSKAATITVSHVNRNPVIGDLAAQTVDETKTLKYTIAVSDPDKEDAGKLSVSATGLPTGAVVSKTGELSWTPTFEQAGSYSVNVVVKDPAGLESSKTLSITVKNTNRKPVLNAVSAQSVDENKLLKFTLTATDPDKEDAGAITFRGDGLPGGASISGTGEFSWTPNYDQAGTYNLKVIAKDAGGLEDTKTVAVTVKNVNRGPKLTAPGSQSVEAGQALRFSVSASDPDKEDAGNLKFSASGLPAGANLDSKGKFSWTPGVDQTGNFSVSVKVTDGGGLEDSGQFSITVNAKPADGQ